MSLLRNQTNQFKSLSRYISSKSHKLTPESLKEEYKRKKDTLYKQYGDSTVSPKTVFTNSELSLRHITVYGFDYDYTLVHYTSEVMRLIYDEAKKMMVERWGYPSVIKEFDYNPNMVIRGLHLDVRHGLLMKMDAYHHIQLGSVHRGHELVQPEEVISLYGGTHIPLHIMDDHYHRDRTSNSNLIQFLDSFSLPEMTLFVDIANHFMNEKIVFDPEYLYIDVAEGVKNVHTSKVLKHIIFKDPDRYIKPFPNLLPLLTHLKDAGKKVFLLTNSEFDFVNRGMNHVTKSRDWRDLFDVIVCNARKPKFYSDVNRIPLDAIGTSQSVLYIEVSITQRPFRSLDPNTMSLKWQRVDTLSRGAVYHQGNINEFIKLTKWRGEHVLYIGDHILSDLTDPSLHLGWKTCAIIPELDREIRAHNSLEYKSNVSSLLALEVLLKEHQGHTDPQLISIIEEWKKNRAVKRKFLKEYFNPNFGSIFRTEKAPSYFSRRLMRFANLYTSSLENLLGFSLDHTFYSRRASLPHEPDINYDEV